MAVRREKCIVKKQDWRRFLDKTLTPGVMGIHSKVRLWQVLYDLGRGPAALILVDIEAKMIPVIIVIVLYKFPDQSLPSYLQ